MSGKRVGHITQALESAAGGLFSQESLEKLSKRLILIVDNVDSASSNRKATLLLAKTATVIWQRAKTKPVEYKVGSIFPGGEHKSIIRPFPPVIPP
eukprot:12913283-Prorocentrum_lima.AAC.1